MGSAATLDLTTWRTDGSIRKHRAAAERSSSVICLEIVKDAGRAEFVIGVKQVVGLRKRGRSVWALNSKVNHKDFMCDHLSGVGSRSGRFYDSISDIYHMDHGGRCHSDHHRELGLYCSFHVGNPGRNEIIMQS
jgi:hypothetical protein